MILPFPSAGQVLRQSWLVRRPPFTGKHGGAARLSHRLRRPGFLRGAGRHVDAAVIGRIAVFRRPGAEAAQGRDRRAIDPGRGAVGPYEDILFHIT